MRGLMKRMISHQNESEFVELHSTNAISRFGSFLGGPSRRIMPHTPAMLDGKHAISRDICVFFDRSLGGTNQLRASRPKSLHYD